MTGDRRFDGCHWSVRLMGSICGELYDEHGNDERQEHHMVAEDPTGECRAGCRRIETCAEAHGIRHHSRECQHDREATADQRHGRHPARCTAVDCLPDQQRQQHDHHQRHEAAHRGRVGRDRSVVRRDRVDDVVGYLRFGAMGDDLHVEHQVEPQHSGEKAECSGDRSVHRRRRGVRPRSRPCRRRNTSAT